MTVQNANYSLYLLSQTGGAKELSSIEGYFPIHADNDSLIWVQCNKCEQTSAFLASLGMIPSGVIDILCAEDTRPRSFTLDDSFVGIFRTVSANIESSDADETASVHFFVNKNIIVTVQEYPLVTMDRMKENFQKNVGPKTAADCLMFLLDGISERIAEVITDWDAVLDQLENTDNIASSKSSQITLTRIRKKIVTLRRYLIPQREAFNRMSVANLSWLDANNQYFLKEAAESMVRLVEDLEEEKDLAELVQGAISSQSQQDINQKMYFLSIIAAIFLPITFATGLLGSNLAGIPFADKPWAFPAFCLSLLIIAMMIAIFLRYRRWF